MNLGNYGVPSIRETPAVVWMVMVAAIIILIVMAKVFADVSVSAGVKL